MRTNDKVLLENINDYFSHKGMAPNLIDDIKENLRNDLKRSESKDEDYLDYRGKSPKTNYFDYSTKFIRFTNESCYFLYYEFYLNIISLW